VGLGSSYLSPYLKQLEALHLIERRIPATIPPERRRTSRNSRYHLADSYLRFYFRFIAPNLNLVEQELTDLLWERIGEQFRAFVGETAFEDLCREWVLARARARKLPFAPELVGSHWAPDAQVDVVAVNWRDQAILLGECKWGVDAVGRSVVRDLVDKAPRVVPGEDWQVHHAFFARSGLTDAARAEAEPVGGLPPTFTPTPTRPAPLEATRPITASSTEDTPLPTVDIPVPPTPAGVPPDRLVIPRLGLDAPVEPVDMATSDVAPGVVEWEVPDHRAQGYRWLVAAPTWVLGGLRSE
jgi:hypothetical protein